LRIPTVSDPNPRSARLIWVSSLERRNVPWFPSDPNAGKNAALDSGIAVGPAIETMQRKAWADGGVGHTDRTRR